MAKKNDTRFFENKLLDFVTAKDPLLEMLQWVMDKFMEIEVAHKICCYSKVMKYHCKTCYVAAVLCFCVGFPVWNNSSRKMLSISINYL